MSEHTKAVTDLSFHEDVEKSAGLVLVDFWAEWCGPCKQIGPALEELAQEFAGQVTIAKVDVDENKQTAARFNLRGIPTLILFRDGKPVDTKVGALRKSQLHAWISGAL